MEKKTKTQLTTIACISIFIFAFSISTTERLIPNLEDIFNILHTRAGIIISSNVLGFLISIILGGILSDFLSKKLLIIIGFILMLLGSFIFGSANTYPFLLYGNFFMGISGGLIEGIFSIIILDLFNKKRGMALNLLQVFFGIGAGIAPFFATIFINWRYPYFIIALFSIIMLILISFQSFKMKINEEVRKYLPRSLIFNLDFILIVFGMFFYSCTEMGIASWISTFFIKQLQSPEIWGTLSLSSYWLGEFIGRITLGLKVDSYKSERFLSLLFFLSSILLLLALLTKTIVISYIFFSLSGIVMGPLWPTILSDARNKFTSYPGTAFGIIAGSGSFAGIIIPAVIGKIADKYSISTGMFLITITAFSSSLIYLYLSLKEKNEEIKR